MSLRPVPVEKIQVLPWTTKLNYRRCLQESRWLVSLALILLKLNSKHINGWLKMLTSPSIINLI